MLPSRRWPLLVTTFLLANAHAAEVPIAELQLRETEVQLTVSLDYERGSLAGHIELEIENVSTRPATAVPLSLNRLMQFKRAHDDQGRPLTLTQDVVTFVDAPRTQINHAVVRLPEPLAPGARTSLTVEFSGYLVGYTETGSLYIRDHIDDEFSILRADAYAFPIVAVPSWQANRRAARRDFAFEARVSVPKHLTVASGGAPISRTVANGVATFVYRSTVPVPFLNLPIARYGVLEESGIRVYHFRQHADGANRVLERTLAAIDLLTEWFGPLGKLVQLSIMEIPDGWGSQASLSGGIIQTASVFEDQGALYELYHELSHLWNAPDSDRPSPRWNEGLASFLQRRIAEELDGWEQMDESVEAAATRLIEGLSAHSTEAVPFARYGEERMTDFSYGTGLLMFRALHELVGAEQFNAALGGYYQRHREQGGSLAELVTVADAATDRDLGTFFNDWLYTTAWRERLSAAGSVSALIKEYREER